MLRRNKATVVRQSIFEGGVPLEPVMRSTDEYTTDTGLSYAVKSDLIVLVGHPHYDITAEKKRKGKKKKDVLLPMNSPFQYRVFKLQLPDPNKMTFPETLGHRTLETEVFVWSVEMVEVTRGGPLGVPITGNSMFAKFKDIENPDVDWTKQVSRPQTDTKDGRVMVGFDGKQTQLIAVGGKPLDGVYWDGDSSQVPKGSCPILVRKNKTIEDGDLGDIGFGNMNPDTICKDEWHLPIEMSERLTIHPDFPKMQHDSMGDACFMYVLKEQLFGKHFWDMAGIGGEQTVDNTVPLEGKVIPSGSLTASGQSIFNKPLWLNQALGPNNGLLWNNELFVTCMDTTHGGSFNVVVPEKNAGSDDKPQGGKMNLITSQTNTGQQQDESDSDDDCFQGFDTISASEKHSMQTADPYDPTKLVEFQRHVSEWQVQAIVRLKKISLEAELMLMLDNQYPKLLKDWGFGWGEQEGALPMSSIFNQDKMKSCKQLEKEEEEEEIEDVHQHIVVSVNGDAKLEVHDDLHRIPLGRKYLNMKGVPLPPKAPSKGNVTKAPAKRRR
ncbi:L1 protein [Papillomaviridae sp. Seabass_c24797]|nr:L1 protein [Papillomaviridae sp. Seabass_c24797]